MKKQYSMAALCLLFFLLGFSQDDTEYLEGYTIKFNENGSKYVRFIAWGQFWTQYDDDAPEGAEALNFSIRRARIQSFAQLNKKFLLLTHFGLNNLNSGNQSPSGTGENSQLFFHDLWGEWKVADNHYVGTGLHYWNGISRLNNLGSLKIMTLDNNRQSWATIGLSDQVARHIGVYAKGTWGKLQYRAAINQAGTSSADAGNITAVNNSNGDLVGYTSSGTTYNGKLVLGGADAGKVYQSYFDFHFLEQESNFLPYKVGTHLGVKKVFNLGAGFFMHPNGAVIASADTVEIESTVNGAVETYAVNTFDGEDVLIFAVDAFYDAPLGEDGSALTAYAVYQNNDYGKDYNSGPYSTGGMLYGHVGYLVPGPAKKARFQPYLSYQHRQIDALDDTYSRWGVGANLFQTGHNSKFTLEYSSEKTGSADARPLLTLQAMIFL